MTRPPQRLKDSVDVVRITPKLATAMLIKGLLPPEEAENFTPAKLTAESIVKMLHLANEVRNRTVSLPFVYKLSRDMTDGNWQWTGDAIQVDPDGFVRNGQHRLLAIVHSGTTQDLLVVNGVPVSAQLVMDTGRPRSTATQLHLQGVSGAPTVTAIANVLLRWRVDKLLASTYIPSVSEVNALLVDEEPAFAQALTTVYRARSYLRNLPLSALGAAHIEAGKLDGEARDWFFDAFITGADLPANSPLLVLRRVLTRQPATRVRARRAGQLYQIVHAWNLWRKGESAQLLRIPSTLQSDNFPKMR